MRSLLRVDEPSSQMRHSSAWPVSGIGVVLNPKSRRNLRDPRRRLSPRAHARRPRRRPRRPRSIDELYRIAEDFRRDDIDVLAISGGDGTDHVTLTGFLDVYGGATMPQVALLRGGTMNTVANSVGVVQGKPEGLLGTARSATYAQRAIAPARDVERHVMRMRPLRRGRRRAAAHYGFLFGTGVVARLSRRVLPGRRALPARRRARRSRAASAARSIGGETIRRMAQPFRGSVTARRRPTARWEERDYLAVAAGTIAHIGLNFRPFHRYAERAGALPHARHPRVAGGVRAGAAAHPPGQPMRAGKTYEALRAAWSCAAPTGTCAT